MRPSEKAISAASHHYFNQGLDVGASAFREAIEAAYAIDVDPQFELFKKVLAEKDAEIEILQAKLNLVPLRDLDDINEKLAAKDAEIEHLKEVNSKWAIDSTKRGMRIAELEAERDTFYMSYRQKCDEETKKQAVEIERLEEKLECVSVLCCKECDRSHPHGCLLPNLQRLSELEAENAGLKRSLETSQTLIKEALGEF